MMATKSVEKYQNLVKKFEIEKSDRLIDPHYTMMVDHMVRMMATKSAQSGEIAITETRMHTAGSRSIDRKCDGEGRHGDDRDDYY
jgi:hypothetical protein